MLYNQPDELGCDQSVYQDVHRFAGSSPLPWETYQYPNKSL